MKQGTAKILSRITTWTLRIMVVLTVLFFGAVIFTASMGGNGDMQRRSLESVIGDFIGAPATIHTLHMYRLFPEFRVDLENLAIQGIEESAPRYILGRGVFVQDPLARMFGGAPIRQIEIDNLISRPGVLGPHSLHIKKGVVVDQGTTRAVWQLSGNYGGGNVTLDVPMIKSKTQYEFDGTQPLVLSWGDIKIAAVMRIEKDTVIFDPMTVRTANDEIAARAFVFYGPKKDQPQVIRVMRVDGSGGMDLTVADAAGPVVVRIAEGQKSGMDAGIARVGLAVKRQLSAVPVVDAAGRAGKKPEVVVD